MFRELGRGGQGTVFLAEDPRLGRRVALKVLTGARWADDDLRQRFLREAEVVSRLDHPSLCTVYEAGEEEGVPFIAMRYVEGETLARQIARNSQPPKNCGPVVALVEQIARALHHAHEAGIIHRDIKPANIMVDREGNPVVLDFGLAKALDSDMPSLTRTGDVLGTPAYMAPESLVSGGGEPDRLTDVYGLGVTLFECLGQQRPFHAPTREGLIQAVRLEEPASLRALNPDVPHDLEVITRTALQRDRTRRYQTALDLAEDLRRLRVDEPILARVPGRLYRLRKFVARHRVLVTSTTAVVLALLVGVIGLGVGLVRAKEATQHATTAAAQETEARIHAEAETARANSVTEFLQSILQAPDPRVHGSDVKVLDVLAIARRDLERGFDAPPEVERDIRSLLGNTYYSLGVYEPAEEQNRLAYALSVKIHGKAHRETVAIGANLAQVLQKRDKLDEGVTLLRRLRQQANTHLIEEADLRVQLANLLATALIAQGHNEEAWATGQEALTLARATLSETNGNRLSATNNAARHHGSRGEYDAAIELLELVVATRREVLGHRHWNTLVALDNLALMLTRGGRPAEAEPLLQEAIQGFDQVLGEDHPDSVICRRMLAECLHAQQLQDNAEAWMFEVMEFCQGWMDAGEFNKACAELDEVAKVLARWDDVEPELHTSVAAEYGTCLRELRRFVQAETVLRASYERYLEKLGVEDWRVKRLRDHLLELYQAWRRPSRGADLLGAERDGP